MSESHIPPTEAELEEWQLRVSNPVLPRRLKLYETKRLIHEIRRLRKLCGEAAYAAEHLYFTEDLRERLDMAAKGRI